MGIVTNGVTWLQKKKMKKSTIGHLFNFMVVSDDVGIGKPHPKIFEYALTQAKVTKNSKILMIGDNFKADIKGAIEFGIDACWYNPHKMQQSEETTPTFSIQCLKEILHIVN